MTKRWTMKTFATMAVVVIGAWLAPNVVQAAVPTRVNADYTASPPFVSNIATPNILIIMDNSGSMSNRACESSSCGVLPDGTTATVTNFVATTRYNGFADPLQCYVWDATDSRFENGAVKSALNTACPGTQWDGNFINWASFRRFDAVKKAMIGGNCWHPTALPLRNTDGTCKPSGTPSLPTVRVQNIGTSTEVTVAIPYSGGIGDTSYVGRMPTAAHSGNPGNIYVQIQGNGDFCVDNDGGGGCPDGDGFPETELRAIGFAMYGEPTGVIQQIGDKARFGLAVFNDSSSDNGIKVLTGIGSRQSVNFNGTSVETFGTNTAAMIDAVEESYPATWTPLAESLYDAVRYVAQINSAYYPSAYTFPIAFSGGSSNGVAFQGTGAGSVGSSEVSALVSGENCPSGYIANACGRDPYFFGANHTPAWASTSQVVNCCKTFILIFTDGEPTEDRTIPNGLKDNAYNGVDCTNSDNAAPPRPVDGTCNTHSLTPFSELLAEHKTDYASNGSGYLDSVAFWAHTNDLRPCSGTGDGTIAVIGVTGHCLPGKQDVTVYTFFAFGNINGRGILAQTARLGAFDDTNGNGIPDSGEWDKENNYTGATGADGIPDAYFESSDVEDIQDKMLATLSSIIRKSSSGAAVSVLATSSTGEGALYQAYFYPSTLEVATNQDVIWTGYTQSLWVDTFGNMREDTNGDGKQDYKVDLIVKTRLDSATSIVYVDKYSDTDGNGIADDVNGDGVITQADCHECSKLLSDLKPIWEAGKELALKDASTRTILTWVDLNNDKRVDSGEQIDFTTANSATLGPYLRAAAAPSAYTAPAIINFIRGCETSTCTEQGALRDRRLTIGSSGLKTWKLGDVINAPPTVVAAPRDRYDIIEGDPSYTDFFVKYRTRRQVVYVGANDGMLHAFNAGFYHPGDDPSTSTVIEHGWFTRTPTNSSSGPLLGEELWGFIPYELLPHLQWLTRSDYQHVYYVDMPPVIKDVRIFANDADHPNGWGTVLIGGFRLGGSCGGCVPGGGGPPMGVTISGTDRYFYSAYFVLDITNPEIHPKLLWSFSDSTLGLTSSMPTVVRVNPWTDFHADNTNAKWYLLAGSGPTGYDGRATQGAKVFAIDMTTGPGNANSLVSSFQVGTWNSFVGDLTAFDRNLDYRTDVVYFGRVINDGSPPWRGKVYRLTMGATRPFGGVTSPASWGISEGGGRVPTEMLDTIGISTPVEMGPVMAAPSITVDDAARAWVFVGSGRYFGASDKTDKSTQYFVGMKDSVINDGCAQANQAACRENDLVDVTAATICVVGFGNCGQTSGTNQVTGVTGATTMAELINLVGTKDGWVTKLLPTAGAGVGERVLSAATVFGGVVFFPTFTPTDDICASTGSSSLYALFYKTGGPHTSPIVGSTSGAGGIVNVNRSTSLGNGLAFGAVPHVGSGADGTSPYRLFINTSTGALDGRDVNLAIDPRAHFDSWINM